MNNNMDADVNDILALLQQGTGEEKEVKKTGKKVVSTKNIKTATPSHRNSRRHQKDNI